MQQHQPKTIIAEFSNKLLRLSLPCMFGIAWFLFLWGLSLPALLSGLALGMLIWLCIRQYVKTATKKRETRLRRTIGGELALSRLLIENESRAVKQCFEWLKTEYRLSNPTFLSRGVLSECGTGKILLSLLNFHPSQQVTTQHIVDVLRNLQSTGADKLLLCTTAPLSKDASAFLAKQAYRVQTVSRDELVCLAGACNPATDDDLRLLAAKKRIRRSSKQWLAVICDPARAGRYLRYGLGFSLFAFFTGSRYYLFPGMCCLGMYAGSKVYSCFLSGRTRWKA